MVSGHPKSTGTLRVDGLSTRPPDLERHKYTYKVINNKELRCKVCFFYFSFGRGYWQVKTTSRKHEHIRKRTHSLSLLKKILEAQDMHPI